MTASLDEIQQKLETHFARLAQLRGCAAPVFALEHNLTEPEFKEVAALLKAEVAKGQNLEPHWLLWVIYAAEHGYGFDGDEYWQSFEERTPRWRDFGSRNSVRGWFQRFRTQYAGVKPSGPWARHRTIISWPITNAILPRDLQFQFARTLHYARHRLASAGTLDAGFLGRVVKRESWHSSSRFQQFVEQEELVGRLVLAILGAEEAEGDRILSGATLKRIVCDLERTRQAKEWLEGARGTVIRFKGANRLPAGATASSIQESRRAPASRQSNLHPTILLRRVAAKSWEVALEVPSFAHLLNQSDELRAFLSRTRSTIRGTNGTMVPSSWLIGSNRIRKLLRWPEQDEPVLQFERPNPNLDVLLRAEGTLSKGPIWPCRVHEDGTASEVLGKQVRPNQTYILLHTGGLNEATNPLLVPCETQCEGVEGFELKIPKAVSVAQEAFIAQLGLQLCRTVRLWPAGLAARGWDGEGSCEWLTTEKPSFGIVHDHPVNSYSVSLNGGAETIVPAGQPGQAVFITLPELEVGNHVLKVRAMSPPRVGTNLGSQKQAEGMVSMTVREPAAWVPGTTAHGGLVVNVDPGTPDLDDLTTNRLHIQIQGPEERQIEVALRTIVPPSNGWLARTKFKLPKSILDWSGLVGNAIEDDLSVTSRAELVIFGDELGEFHIPLEREAAPLRWACKRGARTSLRMIDEAGDDVPARVTFIPFQTPLCPLKLDPEACRESFVVDPPGGLFRVEGHGGEDAIIVSVRPSGSHLGFDALGVQPSWAAPNGKGPSSGELLDLISLWGRARTIGPLAPARKSSVVQALEAHFYAQLCGHRWAQAEIEFRSSKDPTALQTLGENIGTNNDARSFSAVIRRGQAELAGKTGAQRAEWFGSLATRYNICGDATLSSLALRLATEPQLARMQQAEGFDEEVAKLADFGMLTRGARLAALLPEIGAWRW